MAERSPVEIDLYRLTVAFKVSEQAMSIRLAQLDLVHEYVA